MILILSNGKKLYKYVYISILPQDFWIKDFDKTEAERNLVIIKRNNNILTLNSSEDAKIIDGNKYVDTVELKENSCYKIRTNESVVPMFLYTYSDTPTNFLSYSVNVATLELTIGKSLECDIIVSSNNISEKQFTIKYENKTWYLNNIDRNNKIYINGFMKDEHFIKNGDVLFFDGYKIIFMTNTLLIYNYTNLLQVKNSLLVVNPKKTWPDILEKSQSDEVVDIYDKDEYFHRAPRFITSIEKKVIEIDSPPAEDKVKETPIIYTIGPMITMSMTSAVTGATAIANVSSNKLSITAALPTLIISFCMVLSMILWPSLMKKFEKKQKIKREQLRQSLYTEYLNSVQKKINFEKKSQHQIMLNNYLNLKDCQTIISTRKRNLWERKSEHEDFLVLRLGLGNVPANIELKYSTEHFTLEDDNLKNALYNIVDKGIDIAGAPVTVSLVERKNLVIVGDDDYKSIFLKNLILQIITFHSDEDVKLVFMVDDNDDMWNDFSSLSYCWSNNRDIRFFATSYDEMNKVSFYLEQIFRKRKYVSDDSDKESDITYEECKPYYVIITNNIEKTRNIDIISKVLSEERNIGFSVIITNDGIANLPDEVNNFIMADGDKSAIITNDLNKNNQRGFVPDNNTEVNFDACFEKVTNIPILYENIEMENFKNSVGFLEMYNVGKVEQLEVSERWHNNKPMNSLSVPIGINSNSDIFLLDLHEKFHGPHGLVAGMTGSGKSEFIITYILSMAVNFSPYEVSFILIDYKGGGLAGAFKNEEKGIKLPHLAGTITNLDKVELNRSLASIQSELKRRQKLFNDARDKTDGSTMDIYKYQKLFRDKKVDIPVSHLFIISDEFAELKSQQPEFMDQLISTARIGRSLGVHLILATQKPSGVVNEQIWSNSKFRVCLKVQEKSDSMDVIKCPNAAELKNPGRFYLQVGYNDYFGIGQAAWCGGQYYPTEKIKKKVDKSLNIIDNVGNIIKSTDIEKKEELVSQGEELGCVLKHVSEVALNEKIEIPKLWLDSIPATIFVKDLIKKYSYVTNPRELNPIIGEYDNPNNQSQHLLTLNLSEKGNTIIYGSTGSGKELQLTTILYSILINNTVKDINIYIIDFGAEILKMFKSAPQVGDILSSSDDEKIKNLFKTMMAEIEKRKKEFDKYNGSYEFYCKQSGKTMPRILLILNNYEAFIENNEDYLDELINITREGLRYGIVTIITANSSTSIRYKISQNFAQQIILQFNDVNDYTAIYGKVNGVYPSNIFGRGIIKIENNVYEYQTAYAYEWNSINEYINAICDKLLDNQIIKADQIPILPDIVRFNDVKEKVSDLTNVPIGIAKESLQIVTFDFIKNDVSLVMSEDTSELTTFLSSLVALLKIISNTNVIVFDPDEIVKYQESVNLLYMNKDFDSHIDELIEKFKTDANNIVFVVGFNRTRNLMSEENKTKFVDLIKSELRSGNSFVFVDSPSSIKAIEYDDYYKAKVKNNYGLWIGGGLADQSSLKVNNTNKSMREEINIDMGFVVKKGSTEFVKYIDFISKKL